MIPNIKSVKLFIKILQ